MNTHQLNQSVHEEEQKQNAHASSVQVACSGLALKKLPFFPKLPKNFLLSFFSQFIIRGNK
jgi:hypothetical protein